MNSENERRKELEHPKGFYYYGDKSLIILDQQSRSEYDERRREETEADIAWWAFHEEAPDTFEEAYPDGEISQYYVDQAPKLFQICGFSISSVYLPFGIKKIDSWFATEIQRRYSKYTKAEMEKMIKLNPHLHNVIKTNLLNNLQTLWS